MSQTWQKNDEAAAITKVQAGPCVVTQVKRSDKDEYEAVQLGFGDKKEKNIKKPQKNHLKNLGNFEYLREFRTEAGEIKRGDKIDAGIFVPGDRVTVTGTSKGKGFQGVVKRHGFKGTKKTHGNKDQLRMPGSIGATGPAHVFKGARMAGRMGGAQTTVSNLEVVEVDRENNLIFIKGALPGARNSLLKIKAEGEIKPKETKDAEEGKDKQDNKKQ